MVDSEGSNIWGLFQEESIAKLQHSYVTKTEPFFIQKGKKKGGGRETEEGEKKNTFVIQYK